MFVFSRALVQMEGRRAVQTIIDNHANTAPATFKKQKPASVVTWDSDIAILQLVTVWMWRILHKIKRVATKTRWNLQKAHPAGFVQQGRKFVRELRLLPTTMAPDRGSLKKGEIVFFANS